MDHWPDYLITSRFWSYHLKDNQWFLKLPLIWNPKTTKIIIETFPHVPTFPVSQNHQKNWSQSQQIKAFIVKAYYSSIMLNDITYGYGNWKFLQRTFNSCVLLLSKLDLYFGYGLTFICKLVTFDFWRPSKIFIRLFPVFFWLS